MKKYSFILFFLISLLLFGALNAVAAPGDFLFEFGDDYRLTNPRGVAVDGSGNVYVADTSNHRIQVFTASGTFLRKWGDNGTGDGQFIYPSDIAVDGSGNVYVADTSNHRIQVFTASGTFLRKWGAIGTSDGQFNTPYGIAVDGSGNIYVADTNNHRVQVFTASGTFLRKWGAIGTGDGQFNTPYDIAVDGSGNIYVADTSNHRIQVFTNSGVFLMKWGATGSADGQFSFPRSIAVDGSGNIYVADSSNNRIQVFTGTGTFLMKWGGAGSGDGKFLSPYGIALDGSGNVYVADTSNHRIQVFTNTGVFLRKWGTSGSADGQFNTPYGIALDGSGNVYVADTSNNRIQIFTGTGVFLRKWGTSGTGDGQFLSPYGVAVDGSGNVYVADTSNHRIQVFTNTGAFLRKWGAFGTGIGQFKSPGGIAVDGSGNVYVADTFNNRIQVFTGTGTFLSGWGGVLGSGDGQFNSPRGIAVDGSGDVYMADTNNHRIQVFTTTGTFLRKWGTSGTGDGQLMYPHSIVLDGIGNVYVADTNNHRIQVFMTRGTFLRKWGNYGSGEGQFKYPRGISANGSGNIYAADTNNHRIQVFEGEGLLLTDSAAPATTLSLSGTSGNNGWYVSDVQASLTSTDGEGGSGVNKTEYGFDGTTWNTYSAPFTISAEGMTTVYYRSIDNVGNIETTKSQTIQIDKTPPAISGSALPAPNAYGWNNTDVTVSFTGSDVLSGIDTCTNAILSNDGASQSAGGTCIDKAGNISVTATVSGINIDKTPPTVSANVLPAPNANGWNNTDVTVSFTGSDALSGIDTCTNATTLSSEGAGHSAGGTCTDKAGNTGGSTLTINIDKTRPTISVSAYPPLNASGWNNTDVTVSFTGIDGLSGIDACTNAVILSNEGSGQSASGICTDKAGNPSETATLSGINIDKTTSIISGNGLPFANAGPDMTISSSQVASTTVQGAVTDADSAYTFTYRWTETDESGDVVSVLQDWTSAGPGGECPLSLGDLSLDIGVFFLTLEVNDGDATSLDNMTLTINNSVPDTNAGNDITIATEEVAITTIQGSATDFDGDALSCRWTIDGIPQPVWTPGVPDLSSSGVECPLNLGALSLGKGTHTLTLTASDGSVTSSDDMILTISNTPPVANAGENITITSVEAAATTIQGGATDFDGDTITCRWTEGVNVLQNWASGVPVSALSGVSVGCPLNLSSLSLGIGTHTLTLEADDGQAISSNKMDLTIDNSAPIAAPGGAGIYGINTPVTLPGDVSDFDGDTLDYVWTDGTNVLCSGNIQTITGGTSVLLPDCVISNLSLGTHTISLQVFDGANLPVTKSVTVQIIDDMAPTLKPKANIYILWPPNHRMVDIAIAANATDNSGCPVTLNATVTSNEPENGLGSGDTGPDWTQPVIDQDTGMIYMQLRAERSGRGKGRIYTVIITATDCSGNISTAKAKIRVPHDKDNEDREREDREEHDRDEYDGEHDRDDDQDD